MDNDFELICKCLQCNQLIYFLRSDNPAIAAAIANRAPMPVMYLFHACRADELRENEKPYTYGLCQIIGVNHLYAGRK